MTLRDATSTLDQLQAGSVTKEKQMGRGEDARDIRDYVFASLTMLADLLAKNGDPELASSIKAFADSRNEIEEADREPAAAPPRPRNKLS